MLCQKKKTRKTEYIILGVFLRDINYGLLLKSPADIPSHRRRTKKIVFFSQSLRF